MLQTGSSDFIDCHNSFLRLFLRTDSSPLENSDVNKCGAVEYPCPSGECRRFSLRDALKQKYRTTVRDVGSVPGVDSRTHRTEGEGSALCKFFTEGVPASSNYWSNLITNSGPFHCRTQRWRTCGEGAMHGQETQEESEITDKA